jgi:ketosteroid isomerase-like protein
MLTGNLLFSQSDAEYKAKIESLNKEMVKNMLEGNTEKLLTIYTQDAISLPGNEPMSQGLTEIRKASEEMAKSGVKFNSFEPTILKVMSSGNLITEIGTYKISMTVPEVGGPVDDHGKYLTIWEKQKDGSLKVKVEMWNSDKAPMGSMGQGQGDDK